MAPRKPGHLVDLLPVAAVLRDRYGADVRFALVDGRLRERIRAEGFRAGEIYVGARQALREAIRDCRRLLPELLAMIDRVAAEAAQEELGDDLLGCDPIDVESMRRRTRQVVKAHLFDALFTARASDRFITAARPGLVVVGNPCTLEGRLLTIAARARGLPTAAVEHGSLFAGDPYWEECPCDLMCTWGAPSRDALIQCGLRPESIVVTGGPRHDAIFAAGSSVTDKTAAGPPMVLVATSGAGDKVTLEQHQGFIRMLCEAAEQAPELRWVVKLHKKDREEFYAAPMRRVAEQVTLVRGAYQSDGLDIFDWLRKTRALVTVASTAALDAMALDVPVIAVDVWTDGKAPLDVEFLQSGGIRRIKTAAELAAAARDACRGERTAEIDAAARRYAAKHFVNRGGASAAVAEQFMRLMESRNRHGD
jgi:hypothetical protein